MEVGPKRCMLAVLLAIIIFFAIFHLLIEEGYVFSSISQIQTKLRSFDTVSSRPCTFALFREAYKNRGYFPAGGEWLETEGIPHFQPEICKFRYPLVPKTFMSKCLAKANMSYVLTAGDSTGARYSRALRETSHVNFTVLYGESKAEYFIPDKTYFTRDMDKEVGQFVKETFRFCSGCKSAIRSGQFDS